MTDNSGGVDCTCGGNPRCAVVALAKALYETPTDHDDVPPEWPPDHPDDHAYWVTLATTAHHYTKEKTDD